MSTRTPRVLIVAVAAIVCLGTGLAVAQDEPQPWIHVDITGDGDETEHVKVNLPLSAAEAVVALIPDSVLSEGQLRLAEQGVPISVPAIRGVWQELMKVGDVEFVTVEQDDQTVRVARAGDNLEVHVEQRDDDGDETVDVQIPIAVVDALLSGDSDTLNIRAAFEQLGDLRGDIVHVNAVGRQIRVWIDEVAEP